ncbi:Snf7-domain-containing protein [Xylariales sp. PMI_506]|nr:Snf7-domain-containing protein [Xylariales sp. PMI_506]
MNRLFGSGGSKAPKATLDSVTTDINKSIAEQDVKIASIRQQMLAVSNEIKALSPGILREKKREEFGRLASERNRALQRREVMQRQVGGMENVQMLQNNVKSTVAMVDAMKTTSKELKKQYGKIDIDKIERMQDELAELMDIGNEIQESMSRAYDIPEEIGDEELDAELELLGAEMEMEGQLMDGSGVPDFMKDEVPEFIDEPPEANAKVQEAAR